MKEIDERSRKMEEERKQERDSWENRRYTNVPWAKNPTLANTAQPSNPKAEGED